MLSKSHINIEVAVDEDNMPEKISWKASAHPDQDNYQDAKAMLLAFFDGEKKETLKIDLWTKDMQVVEMDRFFFQTLHSMADTYMKSTNNKELAGAMQQFVQYFGEKTQVIKKAE